MSPAVPLAVAAALLMASALLAQGAVPVRVHSQDKLWRGLAAIEVPEDTGHSYAMHQAYKVARKPWADMIVRREAADGSVMYLSRTYDCEAGTWRWLGEAERLGLLSQSVTAVGQTGPRAIEAGTVEGRLAAFACGL
jgi:hypothetical protein